MPDEPTQNSTVTVNTEPGPLLPPSQQKQKRTILQPISPELQAATMKERPEVTATAAAQPVISTHSPDIESNAPLESIAAERASNSYPTPGANTFSSSPSSSFDYNGTPIIGSQVAKTHAKQKMPVGVYIIAGWVLLGFVVSFFDTAEDSLFLTVGLFINLLLGLGLLFGLEVARKGIIWMFGLIIALSVVIITLLIGLQGSITAAQNNYTVAVSKINQQELTPEQQQQLAMIKSRIATERHKAGHALAITFTEYAVEIVGSIGGIVYLTRPKLKDAFHELPT
jgi:uncharacterized protein YlxP (DUF503 family)